MKSLQKVGGVGALLFGVSFALLIMSNAVIQPNLGIAGPADGINPAKVFPVVSTLRLVFSIPILFAVAVSLTALGLNDRLRDSAPTLMRIATNSGLSGAVLFLASGMFAFVALPELASVYSQNSAGVTTADLALADGMATGLLTAGIFASGWWVLLANWGALQGGLPKILSYLGLLFGAVSILAFVIPPFSIIGALVGLVWAIWLGILLWRG
jgi:Domain of unknown function (DUF4386)